MRADKVPIAIINREGITPIEASRRIGKSDTYFNNFRFRHSVPKADTMAEICDEFGYDLVARSREDGFEFLIDPPK